VQASIKILKQTEEEYKHVISYMKCLPSLTRATAVADSMLLKSKAAKNYVEIKVADCNHGNPNEY